MESKFNGIEDVLKDDQFKIEIAKSIRNIRNKRIEVLGMAKPGARLKSNAFSILDSIGKLYPEVLAYEFILICKKESNLALRERSFINELVRDAIVNTLKYYQPAITEPHES